MYTNRILELHRVDPPAGREHARLTSMTAQEIVREDSQPQPQADRSADDTRESLSEYFARPGTAARAILKAVRKRIATTARIAHDAHASRHAIRSPQSVAEPRSVPSALGSATGRLSLGCPAARSRSRVDESVRR